MQKIHTLKKRREFDELFKKGNRRFSRNFTLVSAKSDTIAFAFITPKKNIKLASRRNYARRLLRELVRKEILPSIQPSQSYALIVKTDLKELKKTIGFEGINKEIRYLFNQKK